MRKVVEIPVMGFEATPWTVPRISRSGACFRPKKTNEAKGALSLKDWQDRVAKAARFCMEGLPILLGPIKIHIDFYAATPKGRRHGELWDVTIRWSEKVSKGGGGWVKDAARGHQEPDLLNLAKGTEDALQDIVFTNDVQARIRSETAWFGPVPGARIIVYAVEPGDFPGYGDPVP